MHGSKVIAAVFAAFLAAAGEARATCGLPHAVSGLEAALASALDAPEGAAREAAMEEAARLLASVEGGSAEVSAYLADRAAALRLIGAGAPGAARARLSRFDFRPLAERVAADAENADCPEGEGETRAPGFGGDSGAEAAASDGFDAAGGGAGRGPARPLAAAGRITNRSGPIEPLLDGVSGLLLAALVAAPAAAFAAHRIRVIRRRREGRYLCYLPVALSGRYRDEAARMVDFSRNGARVTMAGHLLDVGEEVELAYLGMTRTARVRWARRGSVGVRLTEPLSDAEFDMVLKAASRGAGAGRA